MSEETWIQILGMRPAIHIDGAPGVRTAHLHHIDALLFRHIKELESVRSMKQSRPTRRQALGVRIVLSRRALPVIIKRPRPRLERNLADLHVGRQVHSGIVDTTPHVRRKRRTGIAFPHPFFSRKWTQVHPAIRQVRRRSRRLIVAWTVEPSSVQPSWWLILRRER